MKRKQKFWLGLGLVIVIHGGLFWFKQGQDFLWFQQDDYLGYARQLISGEEIKQSWLFPGLPMLLVLGKGLVGNLETAAIMIAGLSLVGIYGLSFLLVGDWWFAVGVTVFPPMVFEQTSKLSTASLVMLAWLAAYYLYSQGRFRWASLVTALAALVRPVAGCLGLAMLVQFWRQKRFRELGVNGLILSLGWLILWWFNLRVFDQDLGYQLKMYQGVGRVTVGVVQLGKDVVRAIDWGYWRILASGLVYLVLSVGLVVEIWKSKAGVMIKWWAGLVLAFVLILGPVPMLEEYRRYISVLFPLGLVLMYERFKAYSLMWGVVMVIFLMAFW